LLLVVVPAVIAVMFVPAIVAVVVPIAIAPMVPMASVAEAAVTIPPSLEPAPLAHLTDFLPAMLGLAAEKAVALDVALKLGLLTVEALTAVTLPFARLRGRRTAQQQSSAQRCGQ
jgi:hypothetical protein